MACPTLGSAVQHQVSVSTDKNDDILLGGGRGQGTSQWTIETVLENGDNSRSFNLSINTMGACPIQVLGSTISTIVTGGAITLTKVLQYDLEGAVQSKEDLHRKLGIFIFPIGSD